MRQLTGDRNEDDWDDVESFRFFLASSQGSARFDLLCVSVWIQASEDVSLQSIGWLLLS